MNNDQARAVAGGLQEHSVGGHYPWAVVGIGNGDHVHYEVHNLQTGERAMTPGLVDGVMTLVHLRTTCAHATNVAISLHAAEPKPARKSAAPVTAAGYKPAHGGYLDAFKAGSPWFAPD
jgi:hypothetical protein